MSFLNQVRTPDKATTINRKTWNTIFIFLLGIVLGVFSKWLDNLSINDAIWWQRVLGVLDLRNVFSLFGIWIWIAVSISVLSNTPSRASLNVFLFFVGMTVSYHLYTICFSGFNPMRYMLIWYGVTLLSPILAFGCWYAKGSHIISVVMSGMILSVMVFLSFHVGTTIIDCLILAATVAVLYTKPKACVLSIAIAGGLAALVNVVLYI